MASVRLLPCLLLGAACVIVGSARAEDKGSGHASRESSGGPYCGIYSLYAALRVNGISVPFDSLVQSKYVGSPFGSSLAELRQAAQDCGASARPLEGMTASLLRTT